MNSTYVFTPKYGSPICHILLAVQNAHRRALLLIDNRQLLDFYKNKTKQHLRRHKPIVTYWALMKRQALPTI